MQDELSVQTTQQETSLCEHHLWLVYLCHCTNFQMGMLGSAAV